MDHILKGKEILTTVVDDTVEGEKNEKRRG